MSDFDTCTATIQDVFGTADNLHGYQSKHHEADHFHTSQQNFGRFVSVSASRLVTSIDVQREISQKPAAQEQRRTLVGRLYEALNKEFPLEDGLALDVESQARAKLYAMQVRGFDASRSIMTSAGVTHNMSDMVRVIKASSSREPKIRGVDYQRRNCSWMDMLERFGRVLGQGPLRQLNAGAILADFVLYDSERAPQPDDVDFDCLCIEDRTSFWRLIENIRPCEEAASQENSTELLIDTEAIAEKYEQVYRLRMRNMMAMQMGSRW